MVHGYDGELVGLEESGVTGWVEERRGVGPAAVLLYLAFAATGVGVALPGALLPALLMRWHLGDAQAGRLFLMSFLGSSVGALLTRDSLRRRLLLGSLAVAAAAAGLGVCAGHGTDALMAVYGCGLGMSMTSISLMRQQQASRTGVEMVRLNLLWAIGACVCPSLTVHALTAGAIQPLLFGVAAAFVLLALFAMMLREVRLLPALFATGDAVGRWKMFRVLWTVPPGLIVMGFLITGIESAAGGWLATYARRGGDSVAATVAAPTCLWAGLLLSRLFWSAGERWTSKLMSQTVVVRLSLAMMLGASMLLIAGGGAWMMLAAAFFIGFGIGPVYPLLLAWVLQFDRGGAIFFIAGLGSSLLPWLTGVVSSERASLRMGLVVPLIGTLVMLTVAMVGPLSQWSEDATT